MCACVLCVRPSLPEIAKAASRLEKSQNDMEKWSFFSSRLAVALIDEILRALDEKARENARVRAWALGRSFSRGNAIKGGRNAIHLSSSSIHRSVRAQMVERDGITLQ